MPATTRVTLSGYECANDLLPPVCAACGRPAAGRVSVTFSWCPKWAGAPFVEWVLTRRMTVRLPLCGRHTWQRRWKVVVLVVSFLLVVGLFGGAYAHILGQPPGLADGDVFIGLLCSGGAVGLVGAVVTALLAGRIRPAEISDRHVTLTGVHTAFLIALAEDRARANDPLRTSGYGDARDDYDDER